MIRRWRPGSSARDIDIEFAGTDSAIQTPNE